MMDVCDAPVSESALEAQRVVAENLNNLLCGWHKWSAGHSMVYGFPSVSSSCRGARASRQYDDANGSLDAHIDAVLMEAVDAVVYAIADPWRTALSVQARNLATGARVWTSPRLPVCPDARRVLLAEARGKFVKGLASAGLI